MFTQWHKKVAILTAAALLSVGGEMAWAHDHEHAHDEGGTTQLTLNNGKKWTTDDKLRLGMNRIRDALAEELPAIRAGKIAADQYRQLAQKVNDQVAFMVQNCKLDRDTDAMLHLVLADITAGAHAMTGQGGSEARKGAEKIARALDNYGTYFYHPGWHGVKPAH